MSIPSRPDLIERLTNEWGYPAYDAELMAEDIERLQPMLREPFEHWWNTGELPTVEVEGYTAASLTTEHDLTPPAAMTTLDWLLREPEVAKATIQRGYDRIDTT